MSNIVDYVKWRGDLSFKAAPLNEMDMAVLSAFAYLPMDGIAPSFMYKKGTTISYICRKMLEKNEEAIDRAEEEHLEAALKSNNPFKAFEIRSIINSMSNDRDDSKEVNDDDDETAHRKKIEKEATIFPEEEDPDLVRALIDSPRYSELEVRGFMNSVIPQIGKQFSAYAVKIDRRTVAVIFRGTDNSLTGWKENMDLSYNITPAQREAVRFLDRASHAFHGYIYVAGHSKGGNLAVYASAFCEESTKARIAAIYNFDGPGFNEKLADLPQLKEVASKVCSFVPQSSIVGVLMEHNEIYSIIHSNADGIGQHSLYTWETTRNGFIKEADLSPAGKRSREVMNDWIKRLSFDEKKEFIQIIYDMVTDKTISVDEFLSGKNLLGYLKTYISLDKEKRKRLQDTIGELIKAYQSAD